MVYIDFGTAEKQRIELNSIYINIPRKWEGNQDADDEDIKIKGFWNRSYHPYTESFDKKAWWEVPYNEEILEQIKELFGEENITFLQQPPERKSAKLMDEILEKFDWGDYKPYQYQLDGIRYGLRKRNWILADTMGLGKSYQTIQLANLYSQMDSFYGGAKKLKHCLVICCINSLKYNWLNEIKKFTNKSAVILGTRYGKTEKTKNKLYDISVEETKEQIRQCPEEFFWIINVEKIRATKEDKKKGGTIIDLFNEHIASGELGMIIIDEIHMCRNPQAQQSDMLVKLGTTEVTKKDKNGKSFKMLEPMNVIKIGMSGTLVVNNPLNLYVPMKVVGLISSNYYTFGLRYLIKGRFNEVIGFQNMKELQDILHTAFLRRTKEEVAKDLPPVVFKDEILEMSPEEQKVFDEVGKKVERDIEYIISKDEGLFAEIEQSYSGSLLDKIKPPKNVMTIITRLRQVVTHTGLVSTKVLKSTKFERIKDILDEAKMNGEKVLVFCQFTQAIEIAKDYFKDYNPKIIIGGLGDKVMDIVSEHENTEGFSVIFAQTQTLGVGHSLPNTTQVVFLSLLWDYATFEQCYNRCHRITSKKSVTVTNLIMKDTYDEVIYDKIYAKKAIGDVLVDEKEIDAALDYISKLGFKFNMEAAKRSNTLLLDNGDIDYGE